MSRIRPIILLREIHKDFCNFNISSLRLLLKNNYIPHQSSVLNTKSDVCSIMNVFHIPPLSFLMIYFLEMALGCSEVWLFGFWKIVSPTASWATSRVYNILQLYYTIHSREFYGLDFLQENLVLIFEYVFVTCI